MNFSIVAAGHYKLLSKSGSGKKQGPAFQRKQGDRSYFDVTLEEKIDIQTSLLGKMSHGLNLRS